MRADRVAEARAEAEHAAEQVAAHLDPEHERDAADPERQAERAQAGRPVRVGNHEREQPREDRRRRNQNSRERRRDVALAVGEEDERPSELDEREHEDVAEPAAQLAEHAAPGGDRGDDRGADRDAAERDHERRELADRDLDQQVRDAPEGSGDEQQRSGAAIHTDSTVRTPTP